MDLDKKRIIISIPVVWGVRNFFVSGILKELLSEFDIFIAVPPAGQKSIEALGFSPEKILPLEQIKRTRFHEFVWKLVRGAHQKRFPAVSDNIFRKVAVKDVKYYIFSVLMWFFSLPVIFTLLENYERAISLRKIPSSLLDRIDEISPDLALSTCYVVPWEWPLFGAMQHQRITTWSHILSFDNLTSRGYLPIRHFSKFLVWNEKMADELKRFYEVPSGKIELTGTPQFDFHTNPEYLETPEWTRSHLGISDGPYIVYCANHKVLSPDEPALVEQIFQAFQSNGQLKNFQFVLRLHPMDEYERWDSLLQNRKSIKVSYPWPHTDKDHLYWGDPTRKDMVLFSNTLRYSSLVLNIASTISIDACMHDRPVICIGFSSDRSNVYNSVYLNYHDLEHYAPIMKTGATPLASSMENLIDLAVDSIRNPSRLSEQRKSMIRLLCGDTDGQSSRRILSAITTFFNEPTHKLSQ